jgi:hypothetical protein
MVWANSSKNSHKKLYAEVCQHLSIKLEIPTDKDFSTKWSKEGIERADIKKRLKVSPHIDTSTNNISRLWFFIKVSKHFFYLNMDSFVFEGQSQFKGSPTNLKQQTKQSATIQQKSLDTSEKIRLCKLMLKNRNIPTGRNNEVHFLACLLHEHGVSESDILGSCLEYEESDFTWQEIKKTVKSALKTATYQKYTDEQLLNYKSKLEGKSNFITSINNLPSKTEKHKKDEVEEEPVTISLPDTKKFNKFLFIRDYLFAKYDFRRNVISIEIEISGKGKKNWRVVNE